jgi:hypothetical protein
MSRESRPVDDAIELAARRTREAQVQFIQTPPEDEDALARVARVEERADDLERLASEPDLPVDDPGG